jgi:hypothetical protein
MRSIVAPLELTVRLVREGEGTECTSNWHLLVKEPWNGASEEIADEA